MGYNVMDIIDKAINIEYKRKITIKSIVTENEVLPIIKLFSKVFCNQVNEIIKYYEKLKEEITNIELEEIDFRTYDKMSFLINEFNNSIYIPQVINGGDYLKYSLDSAKNKYSLFLDIQGRLVNNTKDTSTKTYEILSKIIAITMDQIKTIEKTIV